MATRQQPPSSLARWLGLNRWRPHQQNEGYLFLLPSLIGFAIFVLVPILGAFALSFFRWNLLTPPEFAGVNNYVQLIIEEIFAIPGIGRLLIDAVEIRDFPVIQGVTLTVGVIFILSSILADLLTSFADPRVRL